jgi:L-lactate dehydrogenase complex protein LldF
VAGPIGSILTPNLDMKANADLPFASTLCGSCSNVCPVKIDIHEQLWKWRQVIAAEGYVATSKKTGMKLMAFVLAKPALYRFSGKMARWFLKATPFLFKSKKLNPWYLQREMPDAPKQSFNDWYKQHKKK